MKLKKRFFYNQYGHKIKRTRFTIFMSWLALGLYGSVTLGLAILFFFIMAKPKDLEELKIELGLK